MKATGRQCELELYEGREHGFFNYGRGDSKDFLATTKSMDLFLTKLGYLQDRRRSTRFLMLRRIARVQLDDNSSAPAAVHSSLKDRQHGSIPRAARMLAIAWILLGPILFFTQSSRCLT